MHNDVAAVSAERLTVACLLISVCEFICCLYLVESFSILILYNAYGMHLWLLGSDNAQVMWILSHFQYFSAVHMFYVSVGPW